MDDLKKFESDLHKKTWKNQLLEIFSTLWLWVKELSKTMSKLFNVPQTWENQVSRELEQFEENIILNKKH